MVSKRFAENAGFNQNNPEDYIECLRTLPIETLISIMNDKTSGAPRPVLDNDFILYKPKNLLSGNLYTIDALNMFWSVDLMIGYNNADGVMDMHLWMDAADREDLTSSNFRSPEEFVADYISMYLNMSLKNIKRLLPLALDEYTDLCSPDDEENGP